MRLCKYDLTEKFVVSLVNASGEILDKNSKTKLALIETDQPADEFLIDCPDHRKAAINADSVVGLSLVCNDNMLSGTISDIWTGDTIEDFNGSFDVTLKSSNDDLDLSLIFESGELTPIELQTTGSYTLAEQDITPPDNMYVIADSVDFTITPPAPTMTLKVIDVEDGDSSVLQPGNLVAVEEGETVTVTVEIQDKDANVLPIDADFILPISGVSGALSRAKKATFTQGQATVSITWPNSGIWEVTEQEVNADIADIAAQFIFDGLRFKIYEA